MNHGLYYLAIPYHGSEEQKAIRSALSVKAEGREESWGVQQALTFAPKNQIPVYKFSPEEIKGNQEVIVNLVRKQIPPFHHLDIPLN